MFTQECFIRKNTTELHRKLEILGYHKFECCRDKFEKGDVLSVVEMDNGEPVYTYIYYENIKDLGYIDCSTNEDMFLALAALRDNSDEQQYFICNNGSWYLNCSKEFVEYYAIRELDLNLDKDYKWHKATPQEIIEHFKKII